MHSRSSRLGLARAAAPAALVALRKVSKRFRQGGQEVHALRDVDLDIAPGEFLSVVGPSGSGKSSLLHVVGGLDAPTAGEVWVDGRPISAMTDRELTLFRRRKVGVVFQFFNLLPTLTAEENVALPLLLDGRRIAEVRPRVERLLELVGLAHRRGHGAADLSGGEMQRVAIARALVGAPALLLADEPTGNLDSATGDQILRLLRDAHREAGTTIVLVTHDARAAAFGDRTITLKDGRVTEDVRLRPRA